MIIHWWEYHVSAPERRAFTAAQERRQELAAARGFLGRFGGWSGPEQAWAFELWRDDVDAAAWERRRRAALPEEGVPACLAPVREAQVDVLVAMPGLATTTTRAIRDGRVLRLVQGRVPADRHAEIMDQQLRVWRPALARARGMLGGYFGTSREDPELFVGASLWQDAGGHDHWAREVAPRIREDLQASGLALDLHGHEIRLEPGWLVLQARDISPRPS